MGSKKGWHHTAEAKKKISENGNGFSGHRHTAETKLKLKKSSTKPNKSKGIPRPNTTGAKNSNYRGENVSYKWIHDWARANTTKPGCCPICKENKRLECCNVDHQYHRVIGDWFYACQKCHYKYDKEHHLRGW